MERVQKQIMPNDLSWLAIYVESKLYIYSVVERRGSWINGVERENWQRSVRKGWREEKR